MWEYNYVYTDELYHHGVKGQRWGFRRWQNEDGSLTPEGRKRYGNYENYVYQMTRRGKQNKVIPRQRSKTEQEVEAIKKKRINELSDEEVSRLITRLQNEQKLSELTGVKTGLSKPVAEAPKKSVMSRIMGYTVKEMVIPAVQKAGKEYVEKQIRSMLNLEEMDLKTKMRLQQLEIDKLNASKSK